MDNTVAYIDEHALSELVLLRALASTHDQLDALNNTRMNTEQMAMSSYLYAQMHSIMDKYRKFKLNDLARNDEAIGIVVGRFQVPELHDGHKFILQTVKGRHHNFGIALGVAKEVNPKNPLTYNLRASMITAEFPDAVVFPIEDCATDEEWSRNLEDAIARHFPIGKARLYGSRDSFIPYYKGSLPVTEIAPLPSWSGSDFREKVASTTLNSAEFRKGIIFASQTNKGDK